MGEDDLGGHATEDKGEGEAEEHEVVFPEEGRGRGEEPGDDAARVDDEGRPFQEDRGDREVRCAPSVDDVQDAFG